MTRILVAILLVSGIALGFVYIVASQLKVPADRTNALSISADQVASASAAPTTWQSLLPSVPPSSWTLMVVGMIIGLLLGGFGWVGYRSAVQRSRDNMRRADMITIYHGFEAFKKKYGHYPVSTTFDQHYYSLVNLANDWHFYGLPEPLIMRQFISAWPILDPLHPQGGSQVNQYLYYPHNNGQNYDVFVHLEAPKTSEAEDCNEKESIPLVMGRYNYRLRSDSGPLKLGEHL